MGSVAKTLHGAKTTKERTIQMVAPTFQTYKQIDEPYTKSGKLYINVEHPKTHNIRAVRWYSETEYAKAFGSAPAASTAPKAMKKTLKEVLGFHPEGYITIFKGDVTPLQEWFELQPVFRYHKIFGWYVICTDTVPTLPAGIEAVRLPWIAIAEDANILRTETAMREAIDELLYDRKPSTYQGSIGDRIERDVEVIRAIRQETQYGISTLHVFRDTEQNDYVWNTTAKSLAVGSKITVKGTVKEHSKYRGYEQTVLTRCQIIGD
jgi:hypothetical protein